ncbi:hypothetical protein ACFOEE_08645 [Pseudoalteromonas fenneropenaei]|uniref:Orphan protein n=1 Tax=Pseudoalteromonas fenneropenaei TaxID=1737459 RepID=A0ABV7CJ81_9GAMM
MDFYILKKQQEIIAIPADEQNCKQYLEQGFSYVDKVAACNEQSALKSLQTRQTKTFKAPAVALILVVPLVIFAWMQLTR